MVRHDAPVMGGTFGGSDEFTIEGITKAITDLEISGVSDDHPTLVGLREALEELLTA